jgi:hypothetical protein
MQDEAQGIVCSNPDEQSRLGLLLIILALIFMKDNVVAEGTDSVECFIFKNIHSLLSSRGKVANLLSYF